VFTPELVRLSVQTFLGMESRGWGVVDAAETTAGAHARYLAVRVDRRSTL
jgi:hypothetical protein